MDASNQLATAKQTTPFHPMVGESIPKCNKCPIIYLTFYLENRIG